MGGLPSAESPDMDLGAHQPTQAVDDGKDAIIFDRIERLGSKKSQEPCTQYGEAK